MEAEGGEDEEEEEEGGGTDGGGEEEEAEAEDWGNIEEGNGGREDREGARERRGREVAQVKGAESQRKERHRRNSLWDVRRGRGEGAE